MFCQLAQLLHLVLAIAGSNPFDRIGTLYNCFHEFVGVSDGRPGDIFVAELSCVGEPLAARLLDVAHMGAIMFWRRCQVPTFDRVVRPCAPFVHFLVHLHCTPHGRQLHFIVIKRAAQVGVRRHLLCRV